MNIDDHIGKVVSVELDTAAIHEGILELADDFEGVSYVKVINGSEVMHLPRHEIIKITPAHGMGFKIT